MEKIPKASNFLHPYYPYSNYIKKFYNEKKIKIENTCTFCFTK